MGVGLAVAAGASLLSGAAGFFGAKSANKAARKAARLQANLTFEQRMEELRRGDLERAYTLGSVKARAAASGVEREGTPGEYVDFIDLELNKQRNFQRKAMYQERKAIREGAPGKSSGNLEAASSLLSGISGAVSIWKSGP